MPTAIETRYAGTTFRSRLEADYAATFDSIRLSWQYEPEGFKLSDGTWYSPDFYLPTARAWLEVKGDHQQRTSKVEQFAADLWQDAKQPEYQNPTAPLVVLATPPKNYDSEAGLRNRNHWWPQLVGVRGPGKKYSIAITRCEQGCQQVTMIALWANICRNCGFVYSEEGEWPEWRPGPLRLAVEKFWAAPFIRLPRPAGRRS